MTSDVCDECWGSGDSVRTWTNLRALEEKTEKKIAVQALEFLSGPARIRSFHDGVTQLIAELTKLSKGRKERPHGFREAASYIAKRLEFTIQTIRMQDIHKQ